MQYQKQNIKRQTKLKLMKGLSENELCSFSFSLNFAENGLNFVNEHEFIINNEMYDIVETRVFGDSVQYTCYHDVKESELKRTLAGIVSQITSSSPENTKQSLKLQYFSNNLYLTQFMIQFRDDCTVQEQIIFSRNPASRLLNEPPSPPPKKRV